MSEQTPLQQQRRGEGRHDDDYLPAPTSAPFGWYRYSSIDNGSGRAGAVKFNDGSTFSRVLDGTDGRSNNPNNDEIESYSSFSFWNSLQRRHDGGGSGSSGGMRRSCKTFLFVFASSTLLAILVGVMVVRNNGNLSPANNNDEGGGLDSMMSLPMYSASLPSSSSSSTQRRGGEQYRRQQTEVEFVMLRTPWEDVTTDEIPVSPRVRSQMDDLLRTKLLPFMGETHEDNSTNDTAATATTIPALPVSDESNPLPDASIEVDSASGDEGSVDNNGDEETDDDNPEDNIPTAVPISITTEELLYMNETRGYHRLFLAEGFNGDFFAITTEGWDAQINQAYCGVATSVAVLNSLRPIMKGDGAINLPVDKVYDPYHYATQHDVFDGCTEEKVVIEHAGDDDDGGEEEESDGDKKCNCDFHHLGGKKHHHKSRISDADDSAADFGHVEAFFGGQHGLREHSRNTEGSKAGAGVCSCSCSCFSISIGQGEAGGHHRCHCHRHSHRSKKVADGVLTPPFGLSLRQVGQLLKCRLQPKSSWKVDVTEVNPAELTLEEVRVTLTEALSNPNKRVLINYVRTGLGQVGGGHFSPLGAYDPSTDSFLVMDVAKYKYPPVWAPASALYQAMSAGPLDTCGKWDWPLAQEDLGKFLKDRPETEEDFEEIHAILGCQETHRGFVVVEKRDSGGQD